MFKGGVTIRVRIQYRPFLFDVMIMVCPFVIFGFYNHKLATVIKGERDHQNLALSICFKSSDRYLFIGNLSIL